MSEVIKPNPYRTGWQGPNSNLEAIRQVLKSSGLVQYTNAFGRSFLVDKRFILEFNRVGEILRLELGDEAAFALINESQERVYLQTIRKLLERQPQSSKTGRGWKAYLDFMLGESD